MPFALSTRDTFLLGAATGALVGAAATLGSLAYLHAREGSPCRCPGQAALARAAVRLLRLFSSPPSPSSAASSPASAGRPPCSSSLDCSSQTCASACGSAGACGSASSATGAASPAAFDTAAAEARDCPGAGGESAGKAAACEGCPNRALCASGAAAEAAQAQKSAVEEISHRLRNVKKKVMILSGKGGVGKSTVTSQLAWTAASRGLNVGICDVDVCGPSIPLMMQAVHGEVHQSAAGWEPVYVRDNLAVMSIGFLLPDADAAVVWRGPKKNGLIHQFFSDVRWGDLDLLLIDTPPGTSDEHLSLVSLLKTDGAIIVTTPQEAALQDVRKEINFCKKVGVNVLGVVENMASSVFASVNPNGAKSMCKQMEVPYSGAIPLDPSLLRACEAGVAAVEEFPTEPASEALEKLVSDLLTLLDLPLHRDEED
ncbi:putative cytosolic fe-s cluster assembling factor nbp35 [Besnoitia besnoiti]|uniref:Cytosolic Fe-S cluster assembly factor NUBP1 homolog n=1 Tax=Besnoitia besnoiti TaxID=94643 RepID=A0A2A9MKG3_BESBE|nr:putative cytosolic fe-s cluster assembling factor nbp35 [Besnoitia besnoiti]PFH36107.1 putative cytosolic fe-s cluster assembling factor nbp35 [Besnoitia besnoiti]